MAYLLSFGIAKIPEGFPGDSVVKNYVQYIGNEDSSLVEKSPCRREWQQTPVFLPGKSHGQRSLAGYSHGFTKTET